MDFTWVITKLDCHSRLENFTNVVFMVNFRVIGSDGTNSDSIVSACPVAFDAGAPHTPFEQLTKEQVLGWLWTNGVDKDTIESAVKKRIEQQIAPQIVEMSPPWLS